MGLKCRMGEIAYLGRIIKCPSKVRVVSECSLHALYGSRYIGPRQWHDLDRHGICRATTVSMAWLNGQAYISGYCFYWLCGGAEIAIWYRRANGAGVGRERESPSKGI